LAGLLLSPRFLHASPPVAASAPTAAAPQRKDAAAWRLQAASLPLPESSTEVLSDAWINPDADPSTPMTPGAIIREDGWTHVDTLAALRFLAEEARDMTLKKSLNAPMSMQEHEHMQGIRMDDQNLKLSLEVLASTAVLSRCTDEQQHLAAALAIELLPDRYVVFDWSTSDGAIYQVRNLAVKILESLSGKNFGEISIGGGYQTPDWYDQAAKNDTQVEQAWKTWWQRNAPLPLGQERKPEPKAI
jgi:hypothetical protein